jgi:hypothetical protein
MDSSQGLTVRVEPIVGSDAEELAEWAERLRTELLDLDVDAVDPLTADEVPDQAKGLGAVAGWLVVQFGTLEGLRAVVGVLGAWCARTKRTVEVSYGADVLKVTGVDARQQKQIIDAWLAHHAPGT